MNLGQIKIGEYQATAVLYIDMKTIWTGKQKWLTDRKWRYDTKDPLSAKSSWLKSLNSLQVQICYNDSTERGEASLCGLSMAQEIENIFNMFSTFLRIIFATVHLYPRKRFSIMDMRETDFFCDPHIVFKIWFRKHFEMSLEVIQNDIDTWIFSQIPKKRTSSKKSQI